MRPRLGVVIVTHNSAGEVGNCLRSIERHAGHVELELVVVDTESSDGTAELVERDFPETVLIRAANRGYAAALNEGAARTPACPYLLFCNPDIELVEGRLSDLVDRLERRPRIGLAGVRQIDGAGRPLPTIRRRPSGLRTLAEALGTERLSPGAGLGERDLDLDAYERERRCDWVSGSFMLCRRAALEEVGGLDESFFLYSEETDLALRIGAAGFEVVHLPQVTIVHDGKHATGKDPALEAQAAHSRLRLARKHLRRPGRAGMRLALVLGYLLRLRRPAARQGLRAALGLAGPPFPSR